MDDLESLQGPKSGSDSVLRPGASLGGWRLGRKLGEGTDGVIFAARREEPTAGGGIERAILKLAQGPAQAAALAREAEVLAAVSHPGVIAARGEAADLQSAAGMDFLVLAPEEGESLAARLAEGERFSETDLLSLLRGLAKALEAIHAAGYLHRDLKPGNILLRSDGKPLIIDLGAAAPLDGDNARPEESRASAGYSAPELYLEAGREGPWSDLYSLAAVAYRIVTGRAPLAADQRLRGQDQPAALALGEGNWRPALLEAIDAGLTLDSEQRPRAALAWLEGIEAALKAATALVESEQAAALPPEPAAALIPGEMSDDLPPTERIARKRIALTFEEIAAKRRAEFRKPPPRRFGALGFALVACFLAAFGFGGWEVWLRFVKTDWSIDPEGGGDAHSVGEALIRAKSGAILHLAPGLYRESLLLDRPLVLEGPEAAGSHARFEPPEGPCALALAEGLTLRRLVFARPPETVATPAPSPPCLELTVSATLEDISVSDSRGTALLVRGGADPALTRLTVTATQGAGLIFEEQARGTLSESHIAGSGKAAIIVRGGARPTILDSVIEKSGAAGILVTSEAAGLYRNNDIRESAASAVEIRDGADPELRGNRLEGSAEAGLYVYEGGRGRIEENRIADNALSGVVVGPGGAPLLRDNEITGNGQHGIALLPGAGGEIEDNGIADNKGYGLALASSAVAKIGENRLSGNREPQTARGRLETAAPDKPDAPETPAAPETEE